MLENTSGPSAALGALILVPIALVLAISFIALKFSSLISAKWEQLQAWRNRGKDREGCLVGRRRSKRKNSDISSGQTTLVGSTSNANDLESATSSWGVEFTAEA